MSTAPAGGGLAGETTTDWKTGSGLLKVLDKSITSNLLKRSDHFWSIPSSLLSVEGLDDLAGDGFLTALPLSPVTDESVFLSFTFLLLNSPELFVFLAFTSGVLLASSELKSYLSFATRKLDLLFRSGK